MNIKKQNLAISRRSAFTLIELLLVIAMIAVLSTLAVGVVGSSQNDARLASTRARILAIGKMFEVELEDYEVRRSPIRIQTLTALTDQIITDNNFDRGRFLLHLKNLKRLFTADLIRTEMPNGRANMPALGVFPSPELQSYLANQLNVPLVPVATPTGTKISIAALRQIASANTLRWANWQLAGDPAVSNDAVRDQEQKLTDSSELLYQILSQLEFDGTSGLDSLGSAAVGDTDGDSQPEIVDAWGDPIAFQFQQRRLVQNDIVDQANGVWRDAGVFTDFEIEDDTAVQLQRAAMPVLPSQIRLYLSSEKLLESDGKLQDFLSLEIPVPLEN